ncbi:cellulase (glycosyl hydrolase family 5) [Krasilnikovia cinnamomea]|uniref:mannan endo-1,4-beta-mannosidase n=1 Tax=Krasilnikovia cinnamomea TaxID=349313 RepID=A0A4Q7ZMX0_9ACTN|nr:carbohydrate-binding domain-containing protein [Krasilnikovia cinnamomea]RZU52368.1 cellulase (glycosyl hydrolase family 5) [Krasilnikovia cinnamomea]
MAVAGPGKGMDQTSASHHRKPRPSVLPRRIRLVLAATTAATVTGVTLTALPAAAATRTVSLQGEAMTISSAHGGDYRDRRASGGRALAIWHRATASATLNTPVRATRLQVTAMGGRCGTAVPQMRVTVDGVTAGVRRVSATRWTTYTFTGSWAAGKRRVGITFLNPYGTKKCDRFVEVDRVVAAGTATAPTAPPVPAEKTAPAGFVTRSGSKLMLGGKPFKYVGLNAYGMSGCDGRAWSDTQLADYFARLAPNTVTRTWAFRPFGTAALDRIVAAAAAHQQKVIFTLADGRNYCGEHDGAVVPEGGDKSTAWYAGGYRTNYLPWVTTVVSRFKDDPTVAMWEMINEPGSFSSAAYTDALVKGFFDTTAAKIKSIDPNHLVGTGVLSEDMKGTGDYATLHASPHIDVASLHEYEYDWNASNSIITGHLARVLAQLAPVGKPVIIGETGVQAGPGCRTSVTSRNSAISRKLTGYTAYPAVAGVNVWSVVQYDPWSRERCPLEMPANDPVLSTVRSVQAGLNGE